MTSVVRLRRVMRRWARDLFGYWGDRHPEPPPAERAPGRDASVGWELVVGAIAVAILLPVALGAALVPVRDDVTAATIALALVVPVVVAALIGGMGPAAVAAVSSVLSFDVLFTEPYYRLTIDAVEDVEIATVLLVIGLLVGQLAGRQAQLRRAAQVRVAELDALAGAIGRAATNAPGDELVEEVGDRLSEVLNLERWEWAPHYRGTAGPVLHANGSMSPGPTSHVDGAALPTVGMEIPVGHGGRELGRFVVQPGQRSSVSIEQRRVAGALATVLGMALQGREPPAPVRGGRGRSTRRSP